MTQHSPPQATGNSSSAAAPIQRWIVSIPHKIGHARDYQRIAGDVHITLINGQKLILKDAAKRVALGDELTLRFEDGDASLNAWLRPESANPVSHTLASEPAQAPSSSGDAVAVDNPSNNHWSTSKAGSLTITAASWLGFAGLVAALGSGGSGSSSSPSSAPSADNKPAPTTLSLTTVAGPFVAALNYEVFNEQGQRIASGTSDSSGRLNVTLPSSFTGWVMIKASDRNGSAADYIDEKTASATALDAPLRALVEVLAGKTSAVTVSPLTEIAVQKALLDSGVKASELSQTTTPPAGNIALAANSEVASRMGLNNITGPVTLIINTEGKANADYNENDSLNTDAEAYGRALAKLSGNDAVTGSMSATISAYVNALRQTKAEQVQADILDLMHQGAKAFEFQGNTKTADFATLSVPTQGARALTAPMAVNRAAAERIALANPALEDGLINLSEVQTGLVLPVALPAQALAGDMLTVWVPASSAGSGQTITHTLSANEAGQGYAAVTLSQASLQASGDGIKVMTAQVKGPDGTDSGVYNAWTLGTDAAKAELTVDVSPPTVAITGLPASFKLGDTNPVITFTFSEDPGNSFDNSDISLTGGTLSALSGSGLTRTATFTPNVAAATGGAIGISVASDKFTDAAGNLNKDGADSNNTLTGTADLVRPTVAITDSQASGVATGLITYTFTFSEAVTGFDASDITVTHGSKGTFTAATGADAGRVFTLQVTPTPNSSGADIGVSVGTAWMDGAGNAPAAVTTAPAQSFDTQSPTVAITGLPAVMKAGDAPATITFTFSEDPGNSFDNSDISLTGGTLSALTGSGLTRTATFTPNVSAITGGAIAISVASDKFTDAAGNLNKDGADSNNTLTGTADLVRPTVAMAISPASGTLKAGDTATLTLTFSEAPFEFALSDIVVSGANGTLSNLVQTTNPLVYTATFTPKAATAATGVTLSVSGNTFRDASGNFNTDGADANNKVTVNLDTITPTVALSRSGTHILTRDNATASRNSETITFTFSENPVGFALSDVTVTGASALSAGTHFTWGALSTITQVGSIWRASATFTPTTALAYEGKLNFAVSAGGFSDSAGNNNPVSNTLSIEADTAPPVATTAPVISALDASGNPISRTLRAGDQVLVTVNMDDTVTVAGWPSYDIAVGSNTRTATYDATRSSDKKLVFAYSVASGDMDDEGGITASANALQLSGARYLMMRYDGSGGIFNLAELEIVVDGVNIALNKPLQIGPQGTWPGETSTTLVDGSSETTYHAATVHANSWVQVDLGQVFYNIEDIIITPRSTLEGRIINTRVFGSLTDMSQSANATTASQTPAGGRWLFTTSASAVTSPQSSGIVSLGDLRDVNGNRASVTLAAARNSLAVDTIDPTVTLSRSGTHTLTLDHATASRNSETITFTFSENPVGFALSDVTVTGASALTVGTHFNWGALSPISQMGTGSAAVWRASATFTPTSALEYEGKLNFAVTAGGFTDAAGNNNPSSNTLSFDADTKRPAVKTAPIISALDASDRPITSTLVAGHKILATVNMNENVWVEGVPTYVINLGGIQRNASYDASLSSPQQLVFTYNVVNGDFDVFNGIDAAPNALALSGGSIRDANGNQAVIDTPSAAPNTFKVDTRGPTLTITDDVPILATGGIVFTFAFSEPVTGFGADDVVLSVGTKGAFQTINPSTYTLAVIPPVGNGTLNIDVDFLGGNIRNLGGEPLLYANTASQDYSFGPTYTPGQDRIDLGEFGQLIAPVHVDGQWYYAWDLNGDGTHSAAKNTAGKYDIEGTIVNAAGTGYQYDRMALDLVRNIFKYDANLGLDTDGSGINNNLRFAHLSGVKLALPTLGDGSTLISEGGYRAGTSIDNSPAGEINPTYDDLLAIWDAHNGDSTDTETMGTPLKWEIANYWSATPSEYGLADVDLGYGYVYNSYDFNGSYVAVQIL